MYGDLKILIFIEFDGFLSHFIFLSKHSIKTRLLNYKAAKYTIIVWRNFYTEVLQKEIANSPTDQLTPFWGNDICNKHELWNNSLQAAPNTTKVPTV